MPVRNSLILMHIRFILQVIKSPSGKNTKLGCSPISHSQPPLLRGACLLVVESSLFGIVYNPICSEIIHLVSSDIISAIGGLRWWARRSLRWWHGAPRGRKDTLQNILKWGPALLGSSPMNHKRKVICWYLNLWNIIKMSTFLKGTGHYW